MVSKLNDITQKSFKCVIFEEILILKKYKIKVY